MTGPRHPESGIWDQGFGGRCRAECDSAGDVGPSGARPWPSAIRPYGYPNAIRPTTGRTLFAPTRRSTGVRNCEKISQWAKASRAETLSRGGGKENKANAYCESLRLRVSARDHLFFHTFSCPCRSRPSSACYAFHTNPFQLDLTAAGILAEPFPLQEEEGEQIEQRGDRQRIAEGVEQVEPVMGRNAEAGINGPGF